MVVDKVKRPTFSQISNFTNIAEWSLSPYQILTLGFAGLIFLGAFLLMLPIASVNGESLGFIDALFTATSATCVTGLVVTDTGTYFSLFGQMVIIFLIQAGGLGIMTMTTLMAVLMGKKINLRERLIMQEALNNLSFAGIVRLTLYIIKMTLLIEFIGGTILARSFFFEFGPKGIFYGYWHAVSAFCNAGFDLFGGYRSLVPYYNDWTVNLVITSLIIMWGLGFSVLLDIKQNRVFKKLTLQSKVVLSTTLFLIIAGTAGIWFLENNNQMTIASMSISEKFLTSYFQAVTVRTAGFNSLNIADLTTASLFFMILLMFIGGSPGSTAGGIKTTTFAIIMSTLWSSIRGKEDPTLFYRRIPKHVIMKSFTIGLIATILVVGMTMMLSISESFSFINILFEVTSAFGTVGISTGITGALSNQGKLMLILTMFAGRVGPVTVALALAMKHKKKAIQYPEGKITIG